MPAYLVTLDRNKSGHNLPEGADAQIVFAADATAAKEICSARYDGDGLAWANDSTVTAIVAGTNWVGWSFNVRISGGFGVGGADPAEVTVVGDVTNDTIDEIGAALVVALNALPVIANAAYNSTSQVLTVAGIADNIGDKKLFVSITPPNGKGAIPSLVGTIVDGGIAGAVLSVVLPADAAVIPISLAAVKQV